MLGAHSKHKFQLLFCSQGTLRKLTSASLHFQLNKIEIVIVCRVIARINCKFLAQIGAQCIVTTIIITYHGNSFPKIHLRPQSNVGIIESNRENNKKEYKPSERNLYLQPWQSFVTLITLIPVSQLSQILVSVKCNDKHGEPGMC